MAVIPSPLISHQDYRANPDTRRLLRINENEKRITHFIDFVINEKLQLIARVQHRLEDSTMMPLVEVAEDKIYYLADRTQVDYKSGLPAGLPFPTLPNRDQIIANLGDRSVVVIDISIDHPFYESLAQPETPNPSSNKTYILVAPAPQETLPSLHFSPSANLSQKTPPLEPEAPAFPVLNLHYDPSLEPDPEVPPKPAKEIVSTILTAYQIPDL